MPLLQTSELLNTHRDSMVSGTISDEALRVLLSQDTFKKSPGLFVRDKPISDSNHAAMHVMIEFVLILGQDLNEETLHSLIERMIQLMVRDNKPGFLNNSHLVKTFLAYELARNPDKAGQHLQSEAFQWILTQNNYSLDNVLRMLLNQLVSYFKDVLSKLVPIQLNTTNSEPASSSGLQTSASSESITGSLNEPKRSIALLDVDHTLLFGTNPTPNPNLLAALRKKGIRDVYLFTDMVFGSRDINDRNHLIEELRTQGFTVHGVITPSDMVWNEIPIEEAQRFYTDVYQNYRGRFEGPAFSAFIEGRLSDYPKIGQVLRSNCHLGKPGEAFEATRHTTTLEDVSNNHVKSNVCKIITDLKHEALVKTHPTLTHHKAFMLQTLLNNKPAWIDRIIVADDNALVIDTMNEMNNTSQTPILTLHVTSKTLSATHYHHLLNPSPLRDDLLQKINDYLTWRNDKSRDDGRGYALGWFTRIRHWTDFGKNRAEQLHRELEAASPDELVDIIKVHLTHDSKLHNHSLDSYLLEAIHDHLDHFGINEFFTLRNSETRALLREKILDNSAQKLHSI
jgi:hypothetical protein